MLVIRSIWWTLRFGLRWLRRGVALFLFLFFIQRSTYPMHLDWNAVAVLATDYKFDYLSWEAEALWAKLTQSLRPLGGNAETQAQFVRDYVRDLEMARRLEADIDARFLDNPAADLTDLQAERDLLRVDLRSRQTRVEAILEAQVASVLRDEGFEAVGRLMPPVTMRFTQMPNLLVVSPRDTIAREVELAVDAMSLAEAAQLERQVARSRDMSAIVVPLGGMALFPAMIQESSNIPWIVETFAHEWVHHYFFFFPLGLSYFVDTGGGREALIINETVADIFGAEVAEQVLARYYPEFSVEAAAAAIPVSVVAQESQFDFGQAMHQTRTTVDRVMARITHIQSMTEASIQTGDYAPTAKNDADVDHLIQKVEWYMERRRQVFVANGYRIRVLNQAYFAFYGGYQGGIPGIGGEDPIGPAVFDIRAASPTLHDFVVTMRDITTRDELLSVRDALVE